MRRPAISALPPLTYDDRMEAMEEVAARIGWYVARGDGTAREIAKWFVSSCSMWLGPGEPWIACNVDGFNVRSSDDQRRGDVPWAEFWRYHERSGQLSLFG